MKRFAIHWKDYNGLHTSSMSMVVDGTHRVGNVCRPNDHGHRIGIRTDHAEVYHPFQFAALRTTGTSPLPSQAPGILVAKGCTKFIIVGHG